MRGPRSTVSKGSDTIRFQCGPCGVRLQSPVVSNNERIDLNAMIRSTLCRSIAGDHVLHVILLGVGGVFYVPHTLVPLKSLGLDSQRVKELALKLHAHSVHYARKLVQTRLVNTPLMESVLAC